MKTHSKYLMFRLAFTSVLNIKSLFEKIRERTKELMTKPDLHFPFVAKVVYPHQYITREESVFSDMQNIFGGTGGVTEEREGNEDEPKREHLRTLPKSSFALQEFPTISAMEGELITVLKKTSTSKLWFLVIFHEIYGYRGSLSNS